MNQNMFSLFLKKFFLDLITDRNNLKMVIFCSIALLIFCSCSLSPTSCSETVPAEPAEFRDDFKRGKAAVWASFFAAAAPGSGSVQRRDSVRALTIEFWIQEIQPHHPAGWSIHSASQSLKFKHPTTTFTNLQSRKKKPAGRLPKLQVNQKSSPGSGLNFPTLFLKSAAWCLSQSEDKPSSADDCPKATPPSRPSSTLKPQQEILKI